MARALDVAGWVSCEGSYSRVANAVAETHRSGVLRPHASDRATPREAEDKIGDLLAHVTSREGEILQRLVEGQSTDHIAGDLSISPQTVRAHVQNLMAKLGAHSRVQVVRLARAAGMSPSTVGGVQ
jgi:DNA-binding NarL/FixJ family response regulator